MGRIIDTASPRILKPPSGPMTHRLADPRSEASRLAVNFCNQAKLTALKRRIVAQARNSGGNNELLVPGNGAVLRLPCHCSVRFEPRVVQHAALAQHGEQPVK